MAETESQESPETPPVEADKGAASAETPDPERAFERLAENEALRRDLDDATFGPLLDLCASAHGFPLECTPFVFQGRRQINRIGISARRCGPRTSRGCSAAKQKAADSGGLSQQTGDTDLTTAAVLFTLCQLIIAAFALNRLRGRLFSGRLSRLRCSRHCNLGGLGFGRAATA